MKRFVAAISVVVLVVAYTAPRVAGLVSSPSGLGVSPAIQQLVLPEGHDSLSFTAQVTNDSREQVAIGIRVDDFTALNTSGAPLFLNNTTRLAMPHGLAHWMAPGITALTLGPEQTLTVPIYITDASTLAPGGHYGAVIFDILPVESNSANHIGANTSVSMLVFLTTENNGTQALRLDTLQIDRIMTILPDSLDVTFTNTGNTQTMPRGLVQLVSGGNVVARGIINADSGQVLPATKRLYQVSLAMLQRIAWPGMYTMRVSYRPDGQQVSQTYERQFAYIPFPAIVLVGLTLIILAGWLARRFVFAHSIRSRRS